MIHHPSAIYCSIANAFAIAFSRLLVVCRSATTNGRQWFFTEEDQLQLAEKESIKYGGTNRYRLPINISFAFFFLLFFFPSNAFHLRGFFLTCHFRFAVHVHHLSGNSICLWRTFVLIVVLQRSGLGSSL